MPRHMSTAVRAAALGVLVAALPAGAAGAADSQPAIASITIVNETDPAGDSAQFTFHFSGKNSSGTVFDEDFTLHGGESKTYTTGAGANSADEPYVITERTQDGWRLVGLECVADNNDGEWTTDVATATAWVELSPDEHKTCTFTNHKPAPVAATPLVPADAPPAVVPPAADVPPAVGVLQKLVQPQPTFARISTPGACVSRSYTVTVSGGPVESVTFYRDNRKVRTVRAAPGQRRFTLRLPRVTAAVDTIRARIVFRPGATLRTRTLHAAVRRCAVAAVRPQFTG